MAGPLEGIRVIDLTRYLAGPFGSMLLADYGADVIKVESPGGREFSSGPGTPDNYFFLSANRGKRSVTIDLKTREGRELVIRLLASADVLIENFRPGVMDELGLGASALLERFPRLVYCGVSGFGADGPYRDRPGFDQIAQGMSGFMSLTGTEDGGPTRAGIAIADLLAGVFAAQGIGLALLARERSGRGQVVHTSLLEAMVGVLSWGAGMYFESGTAPGPAGQHHPLSSPYGRFRAADGHVNIAAGSDSMWEKLARVLGRPGWLTDDRFASGTKRVAHRAELTSEIEEVLGGAGVDTWVSRINAAGVPCGPVLDMAEVFADPQVLAREMLVELPHPVRGTIKTTGLPIKLSDTPGGFERRPPLHGEHTAEILAEIGIGEEEIADLETRGIL